MNNDKLRAAAFVAEYMIRHASELLSRKASECLAADDWQPGATGSMRAIANSLMSDANMLRDALRDDEPAPLDELPINDPLRRMCETDA